MPTYTEEKLPMGGVCKLGPHSAQCGVQSSWYTRAGGMKPCRTSSPSTPWSLANHFCRHRWLPKLLLGEAVVEA